MDRCSRWFYSGDAVACEVAAPPGLVPANGVGPRVARIWETCPVCGNAVAKHPGWIAQLVYDDGVALFFDGAKDLFRFLLSPRRTASDPSPVPVIGVFVTSYSTGTFIDARHAFFVVGSDVRGPAGEELVAHGSVAEARSFSKQNSGTRVVGFEQVDLDLLTELS